MKNKIITCILAILMLFSYVPVVSAADVTEKKITVDADGKVYSLRVYEGSDGTVYAPVESVARLGGMTTSTSNSKYTLYYKNEVSRGTPDAGARRITIDKSGKTGSVICCTSGTKFATIENISFSKAHTANNKLYLPIEEILPLLDAKVEITSDGIAHIYKNPVPLYQVLFSCSNLDLYEFDKDYFVLNDVVNATGLIVDSILGFRFDRLDFVTNSGAIKDYSNIFKKLLTDNETYLAAFDQKETPVDKAMKLISDSAADLDDAIGGTKMVLDMAEYMTTSSEHDTYKTFSNEVKQFGSNTAFAEGAIKVVKYANVYYNQVDDHRNMLNAVYSGGSSPADVAANQIYNLYSKDMAGKVTSAATSVLRDYITKEMSGAITKGYGLTPYKIAFSSVNLVIPDAVKEFSSAAEMYFLDKVVEDAYDVCKNRLSNMKYDEKSLENLRLSLIMFLVASKRGHESYGTGHEGLVHLIDSTLEELYLAADSVECVAKGYYVTKKNELSKSIKYINPVDISNNSTSTPPSEDPSNDPIVDPSEDSTNSTTEPTQTPDNVLSGKCGDNVTWAFADGTLTISGTGRMDDYNFSIASNNYGGTMAPWFELGIGNDIQRLEINEGITYIGKKAFFWPSGFFWDNLKYASIPDSVTEIGDSAFVFCRGLTELVIGKNSQLSIIGSSAFYCTRLSTFTFPSSIRKVDWSAFDVDDSINSLTITYSGSTSAWNSIDKEYWGYPPSIITEVICSDGTVPIR